LAFSFGTRQTTPIRSFVMSRTSATTSKPAGPSSASPVPECTPSSRKAWRTWLQKHHQSETSVWVVCYKKSSNAASITYEELVLECLCFGWIDSKPNKIDDEKFKIFCAVRKPKSAWSALNKKRVQELLAQGLIQHAGLTAIETAKANGAWDTINEAQALVVPNDLQAAFRAHSGATAYWKGFPPSTQRAILEWISLAKTEVTRSKRVLQTAQLAAQNIRANQWKPKS
jgi:uncharacterized protein YdeI (YjbR/CyaY-like superfamily)